MFITIGEGEFTYNSIIRDPFLQQTLNIKYYMSQNNMFFNSFMMYYLTIKVVTLSRKFKIKYCILFFNKIYFFISYL